MPRQVQNGERQPGGARTPLLGLGREDLLEHGAPGCLHLRLPLLILRAPRAATTALPSRASSTEPSLRQLLL